MCNRLIWLPGFFALMLICQVQAKDLIIGVEKLNYLPFYTYNGNNYEGFARELFDQFAKDSGHTVEYKILPVARLFHEFLNKQVDMKFPDNPKWKTQDKEKYSIQYSNPVIDFTDGIMVLPESLPVKQLKIVLSFLVS